MLISIVIPHHNSSVSMIRLLKSIPPRDLLEIIIVDDHSEQGEFKALEAYTQILPHNNNIILVQNTTQKKGAGAARNIGIEHCSGKWIVFADADDFFSKNAFDIILDKVKNSNADILFFSPISLNLNNDKLGNRHKYLSDLVENYIVNPNNINELKLRYKFPPPWSKIYSANMIKSNNILFEETIVANDILFSAKCGQLSDSIEAFNLNIYTVTEGENTLTTYVNKERLMIRTKSFIKYFLYLKTFLSKKDLKKMHITGSKFITDSIKNNGGIFLTTKITLILLKNKVRLR